MITISGWSGLKPYGIDYLTGEACGYGYRALCDLEPRGVTLLASVMELDREKFLSSLKENWNSKGVASVMLPHQMITPIAVFACMSHGCTEVHVMYDGAVVGIEVTDDAKAVEQWRGWNQGKHCAECDRYGKGGGIRNTYRNPGYARHQHQMSGRTT